MRGVNKAILIGNLGRDPETRYSGDGRAITNFSIATSETWKDKQTGEQRESVAWHNVVCFARLAEIAGEYLRKGSPVYIEGQLKTNSWEQDGVKKYKTEIHARSLQMLGSKPQESAPTGYGKQEMPPAAVADDPHFEDDIPF